MLASSHSVIRSTGRAPSAEYPANAAWNSVTGICGGSFCLFDEFL